MVEHRQRLAPAFAPPLRDDIRSDNHDDDRRHDDVDEWETPRVSLLSALIGASALRRALAIVPLAILGYVLVWFLYYEPSQNVTARPAAEVEPAVTQAATTPVELPPPARPDAAEAAPAMPAPAPAATPAAPAPPAAVAAAVPSRPLSKDEIKELQGKLGAAGFTVGPIDGIVGPQTQAALRRYAESRRLARPEATQETLLRLRSEIQTTQ